MMKNAPQKTELDEAANLPTSARNVWIGLFGGRPFIRVATLAEALCVSPNTVRSQIRENRFPIPHRHIGAAIIFKFEDVVAWHNAESCAHEKDVAEIASTIKPTPELESCGLKRSCEGPGETNAERVGRIKREVKAEKAAKDHERTRTKVSKPHQT